MKCIGNKRILATAIAGVVALTTQLALARAGSGGPQGSRNGGRDGGGGATVIQLSTAQQVIKAIDQSVSEIKLYFLIPANIQQEVNQGHIKDPRLVSVFKRMLEGGVDETHWLNGTAVERELKRLTIEKKMVGACPDPNGELREASAVKTSNGWNVCFSVSLLTRVPDQFLRAQVIALLAHELTHVFGYDEQTAVKVQKYFLAECVNERITVREQIFAQFTTIADMPNTVEYWLKENSPTATHPDQSCMLIRQAADDSRDLTSQLNTLALSGYAGGTQLAEAGNFGWEFTLRDLREVQKKVCAGELSEEQTKAALIKVRRKLEAFKNLIAKALPRPSDI